MVKQPAAFICGKPLDVAGEAIVDIDHAFARFRMGANDRMRDWREFVVQFLRRFAEAPGKDAGNIMHCG